MVEVGDKFGKLTTLELVEDGNCLKRTWKCECECGRTIISKERYLKDGHRKSCGCLRGNAIRTHGMTRTRLFKIWTSMRERCEREKHPHYNDYGGRGISVCEEWNAFETFRDWAFQNGYDDSLTIDRIDVDGNYEPSNCRWVTMKAQQNNKRNNHVIDFNGEKHTITEWSEITGIGKTTIKERLNMGWTIEETLTKPARKRTKGHRPSADMRKGGAE